MGCSYCHNHSEKDHKHHHHHHSHNCCESASPEHEHCHDREESLTRLSLRLGVGAAALIVAAVFTNLNSFSLVNQFLIFLIPYLIVSYPVLGECLENIRDRNFFNEDFLMTFASMAALFIGFLPNAEPEFLEAVAVMLFFQVGEGFERIAEGKSERSIEELMKIKPTSATVIRNREEIVVDPDDLKINEILVVRPGEKIPADGVVTEGSSSLDTGALTGESIPLDVTVSDEVMSGCINQNGLLKVKVKKLACDSSVAKILKMVKEAQENKSQSERFITRFARWYTPFVVFSAIITAVLGSIITQSPEIWIYRAVLFLVVSCPCALVISVPLAFFGGIGGASRKGILIKGSAYMETLARASVVVFDKTGTLTRGNFKVTSVHPLEMPSHRLLHLAAAVEKFSNHPIAVSLRNASAHDYENYQVKNVSERAGYGISAEVDGEIYHVGNAKLMEEAGAPYRNCHHAGTLVHVARGSEYLGHIVIADEVKPESEDLVVRLKSLGIRKTVMITGDKKEVAEQVSRQLGIDEFQAELFPEGKVVKLSEQINSVSSSEKVVFVGDGINDAPVLAKADVGIAMGALGSDAAIEAADVVLMDDNVSKIPLAIKIARRTIGIARQNIVFSLAVKFGTLALALAGVANMWLAIFADAGVMILAVCNSFRTLLSKGK